MRDAQPSIDDDARQEQVAAGLAPRGERSDLGRRSTRRAGRAAHAARGKPRGYLLLAGVVAALLAGAPTVLAEVPAGMDEQRLGERFDGEFAGVTFRPPAALGRVAERVGELARYRSEPVEGQPPSSLVVERVDLPGDGLPLVGRRAVGDARPARPGLLAESARAFGENPAATVLREDVVYVNDADVGVVIAEADGVPFRTLTQIALVRRSDNTYFRLSYAIPLTAGLPVGEDPAAVEAVGDFQRVLDTVALVDLGDVRSRQERWLINTRNAMVNWTEARVDDALVERSHWRVLRNGRDVGFRVVTEERAGGLPNPVEENRLDADGGQAGAARDGVRVGVRSRLTDEGGRVVDRETFNYYRFNRAAGVGNVRERSRDREEWRITSVYRTPEQVEAGVPPTAPTAPTPRPAAADPAGGEGEAPEAPEAAEAAALLPFVTEIGSSQKRTVLEADPFADDGENPGVVAREEYVLKVTRAGRDGADPTHEQLLPEYYVPRAMGHLAPRLLPLTRERGYMFATWVPARSEVMARYLDVQPGQDVELNGEPLEDVTVVADKLGLTGSVTEHYFDPDTGRYLGSRDKAARVEVVPTTRERLAQIWDE